MVLPAEPTPRVTRWLRAVARGGLAGCALAVLALVAVYFPSLDRAAPGGATSTSPPRATASPRTVPTALASAAPRADAFATAESRAACPEDMTLVDGPFCPKIRYECARPTEGLACAEYARTPRCLLPEEPRRYCIDRYEWPNKEGENPRVFVDFFEAKGLCEKADKRLCRRSEWMLACEGPKRMPYPWGFVRHPSPCNIDRAAHDFDVSAMMKDESREGELARLWQADKIGTHPDCVSSFGAFDMSGNVDEWTDNAADDPKSKYVSTLNGGYWGPVRNTCRLTTTAHGPDFKFYQVGFRCCSDTKDGREVPEPLPFVEGG